LKVKRCALLLDRSACHLLCRPHIWQSSLEVASLSRRPCFKFYLHWIPPSFNYKHGDLL